MNAAAAAGDPIRYATELELCRAHKDAWTRIDAFFNKTLAK